MRLIDADALWMDIIHSMDYCDDILEIIERQPTIEPERKKGKWIKWEALNGLTYGSICSECGYITSAVPNYGTKYCPDCGADMRGEQDETNSRNKTS